MPGIASSAPPVLIGHIADATTTLRVGSGGVMLPNHASLVVAEQFGMLEALHPGRIDLGIGRAPGTDQVWRPRCAARPKRSRRTTSPINSWTCSGTSPAAGPKVTRSPRSPRSPAGATSPPCGCSAQAATALRCLLGLPFAFAHHFSPANTLPALALYREHFRPSEALDRPYAIVAAAVVCAQTDERARWLSGSGALSFLKLRSGRPGPLPSPEEAEAYPYTHLERAYILDRQATQIIGAAGTVRRGLTELLKATAADELMLTTMVFDPADRLRSFELVADLARTPGPAGQPAQTAT